MTARRRREQRQAAQAALARLDRDAELQAAVSAGVAAEVREARRLADLGDPQAGARRLREAAAAARRLAAELAAEARELGSPEL